MLLPTDNELFTQMAQGSEKAFRTLFDRYFTALSVYADKIVSDTDTAIDIVQSFFVNIYENKATLNVQNVRSFMFQSVHNRCLNEIKHRNIHQQYASQTIITETEYTNDVEDMVELSEVEAQLANAIEQLPPQCKKVFEMSRFDGLTNSEIAERLDISKRTVETQISNALKFLRKIFGRKS